MTRHGRRGILPRAAAPARAGTAVMSCSPQTSSAGPACAASAACSPPAREMALLMKRVVRSCVSYTASASVVDARRVVQHQRRHVVAQRRGLLGRRQGSPVHQRGARWARAAVARGADQGQAANESPRREPGRDEAAEREAGEVHRRCAGAEHRGHRGGRPRRPAGPWHPARGRRRRGRPNRRSSACRAATACAAATATRCCAPSASSCRGRRAAAPATALRRSGARRCAGLRAHRLVARRGASRCEPASSRRRSHVVGHRRHAYRALRVRHQDLVAAAQRPASSASARRATARASGAGVTRRCGQSLPHTRPLRVGLAASPRGTAGRARSRRVPSRLR